MRQQHVATNIHEQSILGYRGLIGKVYPAITNDQKYHFHRHFITASNQLAAVQGRNATHSEK